MSERIMIQGLDELIAALKARAEAAESTLASKGFRRCDIAVCNCNGWHGGHSAQRLCEIGDALADAGYWANGPTILEQVNLLISNLKACELERSLSEPVQSLDRLRALKPGWDSYNGKPIDERALKTAEAILSTPGQVVPCSNGGVQVEWHCGGVDVEICIGPDGAVEEDARPDTARLNWIENCPGGISVFSGDVKTGQKPTSWDVWNEEDDVTRQTLRAALDAARAAGKKEG